MVYKQKVRLNTLIPEVLNQTFPVAFESDIFRQGRQIVLMIGVMNMTQQLGPLSYEMVSPSHKVSCCPHLRWIHIRHGNIAAT